MQQETKRIYFLVGFNFYYFVESIVDWPWRKKGRRIWRRLDKLESDVVAVEEEVEEEVVAKEEEIMAQEGIINPRLPKYKMLDHVDQTLLFDPEKRIGSAIANGQSFGSKQQKNKV